MDYEHRWLKLEDLDGGGQGKVYRVLDSNEFGITDRPELIFHDLGKSVAEFTATVYAKDPKERFESFRKALAKVKRMEDPSNHGALKVLYDPQDAKARTRIKREIEAMNKISHPNLLKILDYDDEDFTWFVSQFHPKGTLIENKDRFTGDFVSSLRAFRPFVEGVSKLHEGDWVHRDIKPQNVFLDSNNNLVLGDFGLIFFADEQHTRISGTFEKVGTRDWMPPWAYKYAMKIEDVKPTFDVFSLGKLLWAMVSKTPMLPFWYFDDPENDLEKMFPNAPSMKLANPLFEKCIVEHDKDCLSDAKALLEEVDRLLTIIDRNADLISENIERPCKVCGIGDYRLLINRHVERTRSFGITPLSGRSFKIFTCSYCGHVQLFAFIDDVVPPAWSA